MNIEKNNVNDTNNVNKYINIIAELIIKEKKIKEILEGNTFKEILDALTFIEPVFVSRKKFNNLKGDILIEHSQKEELLNKTDTKYLEKIIYYISQKI